MAMPGDVAREVAVRADGAPPQLFDESLAVHEDVELGERIERSGRRIAFAPAARVVHARDTTFGDLLWRNFGMARACRRLGVHRAAQRALAGSVLAAAALAGLAVFLPPARVALAVCAGAYAVLVLTCAAAAGARRAGGRPWPSTCRRSWWDCTLRGAWVTCSPRVQTRNSGACTWPG